MELPITTSSNSVVWTSLGILFFSEKRAHKSFGLKNLVMQILSLTCTMSYENVLRGIHVLVFLEDFFLWVSSLWECQESHPKSIPLPFGHVFKSLIIHNTMIFVSLHALLTFRPSITTTIRIPLTPPGLHAKLSSLVYVISAFKLALVFSVTYENERAWLYNFYFFEACLVPRLRNSHLQRTSINGKVFYSYSIPNPR